MSQSMSATSVPMSPSNMSLSSAGLGMSSTGLGMSPAGAAGMSSLDQMTALDCEGIQTNQSLDRLVKLMKLSEVNG